MQQQAAAPSSSSPVLGQKEHRNLPGSQGLYRGVQHLAVLLGAGRFALCTLLIFNFF